MASPAAASTILVVEDDDALRRIDQQVPALIVLDPNLVRIVTGGDVSDLSPADAACILQKPVSDSGLVDAVTTCLQRHGAG